MSLVKFATPGRISRHGEDRTDGFLRATSASSGNVEAIQSCDEYIVKSRDWLVELTGIELTTPSSSF